MDIKEMQEALRRGVEPSPDYPDLPNDFTAEKLIAFDPKAELQYRMVKFEQEVKDTDNYQGNAVVNYTEREIPYTRIIEHKHFYPGLKTEKTVISREYPAEWHPGEEPYYPINDARNAELYAKYKELADREDGVVFGGRLGEYKYYDMDKVIASALNLVEKEL